jgi:hypothetical protein
MAPIQVFLIISTCVLYLVGAGLFTRCVAYFEGYKVRPLFETVSSIG